MALKSDVEVIIGGKVYTISGQESEEYIQKVASYINSKFNEFAQVEGFRRSNFNIRVFHCMADRGIPAISPDGGLYACEYFPKESRFGDVWHGITDPTRRKEFCRTDRVREKCRDCTFLPFCTPFANCCSEDRYCREVERLFLDDMLRDRMEKSQQTRIPAAEEIPGC